MGANSNLGNTLAVANLASGGAIGTAATTVDIYSIFLVTQTTAGQTITIANPTDATAGKMIFVCNTGNQSFTFLSLTVTAGRGVMAIWDGDSWNTVGI